MPSYQIKTNHGLITAISMDKRNKEQVEKDLRKNKPWWFEGPIKKVENKLK